MASLSSISELMKIEVDKDINGDVDHNFFDEDSNQVFSSDRLRKQVSTDKDYNYDDDFEDDDSETDEELDNVEIAKCFAAENALLSGETESNFYCNGESLDPVKQENVEVIEKNKHRFSDIAVYDTIDDSEINRIIDRIEKNGINIYSDDLNNINDFTEVNHLNNEIKPKVNIKDDRNQCKIGFSTEVTHSDLKTELGDGDNKDNLIRKKVYRELMNTIAFDSIENSKTKDLSKEVSIERSISSDTTSDITDVTPCPSTSGCFSISQGETQDESSPKKIKTKKVHKKEIKHPPPQSSSSSVAPMKFLADVVDSMGNHKHGTVKTGATVCGSKKQGRLNMSFSNEKTKKIDKDNSVLSKKISRYDKPHAGFVIPPYQSRLSSSAINRRRECERIEHDNMILINKLQKVKGVVNSGIRRL